MKDINEATCWDHGLREALRFLRDSQIFSHNELSVNYILEKERGVDILKPYNKTIGVLTSDTTQIDLSDENDDVVDEPATNGLNRVYYYM